MFTRREAFRALFGIPAVALGADKVTTEEPKRLVVPEKAIERLEKIVAEGGVITGATIHYSLPSRAGTVGWGSAFLSQDRGEMDWKIE